MAGTVNGWNNQVNGSYNQIILNAGTNGVAISTDASAATVNVATGGAVKTATFGSTNSTSATTVQSGSGALAITSTNGTLTANSGTGVLAISNDASATTVNIATGAAVKTTTLGSTNTTSSTAVKSGSGNIALNSGLTVDSTGRMTNATQPAFFAYPSTSLTNVTGSGTATTLAYNTTLYNQGSGYNTSTYTFTAPVTGKYYLASFLQSNGFAAGHNQQYIYIITSGNTFYQYNNSPTAFKSGTSTNSAFSWILAPMTAGDTAFIQFFVGGGTATIGVQQGPAYSAFYGYLVC